MKHKDVWTRYGMSCYSMAHLDITHHNTLEYNTSQHRLTSVDITNNNIGDLLIRVVYHEVEHKWNTSRTHNEYRTLE